MAEAVVSPLLDVLIGELAPAIKKEVGLIWGVDKELDNLSSMLSMIQCMLADADERQITDKAVQKWLVELKNIAYDAEDVLDEFAYEALRRELMERDETKTKVCNFFISCCLLRPIRFRRNVVHKIKEINERVDRISRDGEIFHLKKGDGEIKQNPDIVPRPPSSSVIEKNSQSIYVGRDDDIKKIMNMLLSDEDASHGTKDVSVISIVGMGGLGKTTLAQLVYNNENVCQHFEVRAWVCACDIFDISRLTREILESATKKSYNASPFFLMRYKLQEILSGKRFLIVLDDVWNTKRSAWDMLRIPFSYGAKGSKVIVTTRDEAISRTMGTDHVYHLKHLSDDHCLSLFLRHAFVREDCNAHPELKEIGKDLVESHCDGLPLAAKVLGCLLSSKREIHFWRTVLNSQLWSSNEGENEVMKALRISYHHLPPHIKQCFAFCSIFPKYYKFRKEELVNLWMAQGFIQPKHGFMVSTLEEIGSEYLDFLLSRSFFQEEQGPWWLEIEVVYKMDDCIHDLAILVSSDECFRFGDKPNRILASHYRHASMVCGEDKVSLEDLNDCKGIRTIIIRRSDHQVLNDLILNLRYLRVLVLVNPNITELPDSISNLKHLRYLDLSYAQIRQLAESVGSLYNLQTLVLKNSKIIELPDSISNLKHLRYLDLSSTKMSQLPESVSSLHNLQTLVLKNSKIIEVPDSISNLKYLRYFDLSRTQIQQLPESVSSLHNLQTLHLKECFQLCQLPKETRKLVNLRHLNLEGCFSLQSMPPDMGSLTNLQTLVGIFIVGRERGCGIKELKGLTALKGCLVIRTLPNVSNAKEAEEANLKDKNIESLWLEFGYYEKVTNMRHEELGKIFEALQPPTNIKSLGIFGYGGKDFPSWFQSLTSLEELRMMHCPQLSLPEGLPTSLNRLLVFNCPELEKRCRKEDGEDWLKISHIREVLIH